MRIKIYSGTMGLHPITKKSDVWLLPTHFDIEYPDKVRPLEVVFHQAGHTAAFFCPGWVSICCIHLRHPGRQSLQGEMKELCQIIIHNMQRVFFLLKIPKVLFLTIFYYIRPIFIRSGLES